MHFSTTTAILSLLSLISAAAIEPTSGTDKVTYDNGYDDTTRPMTVVSCSDGVNGLVTKHPSWVTQGDIPVTPNVYIGGASSIEGWNSKNCGKCYKLTYAGNSIFVLAIDHALQGFNIAQKGLDKLTGGQAVALGKVTADWAETPASDCGL